MADLESTEKRLMERRETCNKMATLPEEKCHDMMTAMYAKWIKDYEQDLEILGCVSQVGVAELVSCWISDRSSRILDCASGTGLVGQELKKHGFLHIDALDMSKESLDYSKEKNVYTNYICHRLGTGPLPFEDCTYDAVTIAASFGNSHVRPDCFLELLRIIKPGGFIVFDAREEVVLYDERYGNGKLDDFIHRLAVEERCELLQKHRCVYMKFGNHGKTEYDYAYVLRKMEA